MARSDPEKLAQALRANLRRRKTPPAPKTADPAPPESVPVPPQPPEKPAQP
jgi:hypothetical protein